MEAECLTESHRVNLILQLIERGPPIAPSSSRNAVSFSSACTFLRGDYDIKSTANS
jgi:hypothetical protein